MAEVKNTKVTISTEAVNTLRDLLKKRGVLLKKRGVPIGNKTDAVRYAVQYYMETNIDKV